MFIKFTVLCAFLAVLSLCAAYKITPNVIDGIPASSNITTDPFLKIGLNYYFIESKIQKNWYAAFESCRQMEAELIAYDSLDELKLISKYLIDKNIVNSYWASGNDLAKQGNHVWHSSGQPVASDLWHKGEPNNNKGKEHCDHLWINKGVGGLNDYVCSVARLYICKAKPKTASFTIW